MGPSLQTNQFGILFANLDKIYSARYVPLQCYREAIIGIIPVVTFLFFHMLLGYCIISPIS